MANINNPELVSFGNFMLAKHGITEVVKAEDLAEYESRVPADGLPEVPEDTTPVEAGNELPAGEGN